MDVRLRPGTKPIFKKARPVTYSLQSARSQELRQEGILEPVKSSNWATPIVVVLKANGRLCVCGDYKVTINQCVKKKVYPLSTTEDLLAQIAEERFFSKLDMSQASQQLTLDKDGKNLLVVNTPKGLFRYTKLPYGISTAPAICQSVMDRILQGLPVACYLARSIVWWPNMDKDIEDVVTSCQSCVAHQSLPPVAPLHSWPWASHPMQRIHIDFASIEQFQVLVIIDNYSKWIKVMPLHSATASSTVDAFRL